MRKTVSAKKIGHKTPLLAHALDDRMFVVIGRVEINSNSSRKRPHTTHELISIPEESVERSILLIRSQNVILDRTLAKLYGVSTKVLNQAVKRNLERFPQDFICLLTMEEANGLELTVLRSQNVTLKKPRRKHLKEAGSMHHRVGHRIVGANAEGEGADGGTGVAFLVFSQ